MPNLLQSQADEGFFRALDGDRSLYQHQEQAITKVSQDRNIVVATGTGSGKTECFLYPILIHLYEEFLQNKLSSGVRALILYPMNALANDQRERLGAICQKLREGNSRFEFTFGQYIGETPEDKNDWRRHAHQHLNNRLAGEVVLRSEMRASPPHILLTNYSMLEYLLLRPNDSPLFDSGSARSWKFMVLDEAHQYRGAKGIEMAMLLRRLKQRLREGGRSEPFFCIATSATLTDGEADKPPVANFASELFGEQFNPEDIILGETVAVSSKGHLKLSPQDYEILKRLLMDKDHDSDKLASIANRLDGQIFPDETLAVSVGRILRRDSRVFELRQCLSDKPLEIKFVADCIFKDVAEEDERIAHLSTLIEILLQTQDPNSGSPLLSARYHLFLRSLEGAFVSYWPEKKVLLERGTTNVKAVAFEIAICRECGQHYLVGSKKSIVTKKLSEAIRDPGSDDFGATFFRPTESGEDCESEDEESRTQKTGKEIFFLCIECGQLNKGKPQCRHNNAIQVIKEENPKDEHRADQIAGCSLCGYHAAGHDPVREVVYGSDGPNAVIATTLFQHLPEKRKKVLAFADGRQQAAFFAWYLQSSYQDILIRNLIHKVVAELSEFTSQGISLKSLAAGLSDLAQERKVFPPAMDILELNQKVWCKIYGEFLTDEQRISLEGVGLARWDIEWPDWFDVPQVLTKPPWNLTVDVAKDLLTILLDTLRGNRAVEIRTPKGVSISWNDLGLQGSQLRFQIGRPGGQKGVRSWDGKKGKRTRFMAKLLMTMDGSYSEREAVDRSVDALRAVWDELKKYEESAPSPSDNLLLSVDNARRLNPEWFRISLVNSDKKLFQCSTCARLQALSVRGVCNRSRCPGTLKEISPKDLALNHYRLLYLQDLPGNLRVEEHTAQLVNEKAREFQHDFNNGKIHVLSCSTTFELGVDLGNLDTIFLRNVPPEAFNYAQRVGRSGRRTGFPGFAVTYCRRSPHDLYHFAEPERMLSGKARPPVLSIRNEKIILRHLTAVALSKFFSSHFERFEAVEKLFKDLTHPTGVYDFNEFLLKHKSELQESIREIVPLDMQAAIGLVDGGWISKITAPLALVEKEVSNDFKSVKQVELESAKKGDYTTAKWACARAKTIAQEEILTFLSRKAVIPKYGFPVDVVELDTQRIQQTRESFEVSLQRDLSMAIAEFAPTSSLIANKKEWTSYAIKKVPEKEWDRRRYKRCLRHNAFLQWKVGEAEPADPCEDRLLVYEYIIPRFGFVTSRKRPKEPKYRPPKMFTTRPYFEGLLGPDPGKISFRSDKSLLVTIQKASPGRMVVLCEGRRGEGFYICRECGAGFKQRDKKHKNQYDQDCSGMLELVSLGHEFVTDVVQIHFYPQPETNLEPLWFAYSLAYALVEGGAEFLEIPSIDLNATVRYSQTDQVPPIVLYDNVPGGAGLVARLEQEAVLKECFRAAEKRVSGQCGCSATESCYGCLRSYRNQFVHQHLQRGPIAHYLERILYLW